MLHRIKLLSISALTATVMSGCLIGGDGAGTPVLSTSSIGPGQRCEYGGVKVSSGYDTNGDGVIDEVDSVSYACNAKVDGFDSLLEIEPTAPAGACSQGGSTIHSGLDTNNNGQLDASEITATNYVCDGVKGDAGRDGTDGRDGADGADGADGLDGYTPLVKVSDIAPDPSGTCYFGGTLIESGMDLDRDGVLSAGEVAEAQEICAVQTNDRRTLVEHELELPGANCAHGGIKMTVGFDEDADSALGAAEIDYTGYVCNDIVLVDGKTSLVEVYPAAAAACSAGGYVLESGIDADYDGQLGVGEVVSRATVCNGEDGETALIDTTAASATQCSEGGYVFSSGFDADHDGRLDAAEVSDRVIVCNGEDGADGQDGRDGRDGANALVETYETVGGVCGAGVVGYDILSGRDLNHNGRLEVSEVEHEDRVCDGQDGFLGYDGKDSLIRTSSAGNVCPYGGFMFEAGLDIDEDGHLDPQEITSTEFVCDGYNGLNSLVELSTDTTFCVYEGIQIDVGLDTNDDGVLQYSEVESTAYLCDGYDGYNSLVEVIVDPFDCPYTGIRFDTGLDTNDNGVLESSEVQNSTVICD